MENKRTTKEIAYAYKTTILNIEKQFRNSEKLKNLNEEFKERKNQIFDEIVSDECKIQNVKEQNVRKIANW